MKKILIYSLLCLGLVSALGISVASANQTGPQGNFPPLIQKLVERFNLNPSEVQTVLDQNRTERQQKMQTKIDEKLTQAVDGGKITLEQKTAILAKQAEMQTKLEALKGLPQDQRKTEAQNIRQEIKDWLEANNIPNNLMFNFGTFSRGMHGIGPKHDCWKNQ